jgi:hypothetical protein
MAVTLDKSLSALKGGSVVASPGNGFPEPGQASMYLLFANGTQLRAEYWRLMVDDRADLSSFDHRQKYGWPEPIDAVKRLCETLKGRTVRDASLDNKTGDLLFEFSENISLQVFNFTGYKIWEITYPDGVRTFSNYAK